MVAEGQADTEADFIATEKCVVRFKVGKSLLDQFVKTHDYLDCIIEAIQNDFDARSPEISFSFTDKNIAISGKGEPVDDAGWNRLTYSLGYDAPSERKIGTIGNKNQGVRSYLLFGDHIIFRSGGKKVLITPEGSSQEPKEDESTQSTKGVIITIRMRDADSLQGLPAFSVSREEGLIDSLLLRLPGIVSQLQIKGWEGVLKKVTFTFLRSNVCIELVQDIPYILDCEEFVEYNRRIVMKAYPIDAKRSSFLADRKEEMFRQVEYVKTVPLPSNLLQSDIPNYFLQDEGTSVTIGLSFFLEQAGPVVQSGHLYYPLELTAVNTGNSLSINAPFVLDLSRQNLVTTDQLNKTLIEKAAEFVGPLFRKIILKKYGPSAYSLLCPLDAETELDFQELVTIGLKSSKIILNNTYDSSTVLSGESFCERECYLPTAADLYGFIGNPGEEVSSFITDPSIKRFFTEKLEVEPFDIHDVVALWSNDHLSPVIEGWHYLSRKDFVAELSKIETQQKYANAFASHQDELAEDEIKRMAKSSSTLNSSSSSSVEEKLNAAANMRLWSHGVQKVPNLDLNNIVNPQIANHAFFKSVLKIPEFELNEYVLQVLVPAIDSMPNDKRIEASVFILNNVNELSVESVTALKNVKIFRSDTESWCTFDQIVDGDTELKKAFGDTLLYPHLTLLDGNFTKFFPFRKDTRDLEIEKRVNRLWQEHDSISKDKVLDFQRYLKSRRLTLDLIQRIRDRVLTVDAKGRVCPVSVCYENNEKLSLFLGPDAHYVDFSGDGYFLQLGAHNRSRFQDMLSHIYQTRSKAGNLSNVVEFYRELAAAKKRDNVMQTFDQDEIMQIGAQFVAPRKVFIYETYKKHFFGSMTYWNYPLDALGKTKSALLELGCKDHPGPQEFLNLLRWISNEVSQGKPIEERWRAVAHWAYSTFPANGMPQGATPNESILLATNGRFTSLDAAKIDHVYYDDSEEIASALSNAHHEISFFDCGQSGHAFFQNLDVPRLTDQVKHLTDIAENGAEPSGNLKELFERLRTKETINGIKCYVEQNQQMAKIKRLDNIKKIVSLKKINWADNIQSVYEFEGFEKPFQISRGARIVGDVLYVWNGLDHKMISFEISKTVSEEIVDSRDAQSSVALVINAFLTGIDVQKFLVSQKYCYQESVEVPNISQEQQEPKSRDEDLQESNTIDEIGSQGEIKESVGEEITQESAQKAQPTVERTVMPKATGVNQLEEPEIEDQRGSENAAQLREEARKLLSKRNPKPIDISDTYKPSTEISSPVISRPKYVVYSEKKPVSALNLLPVKIGEITVLASPGFPLPCEKKVEEFLALIKKIVESMGGNPETAKVMVTDETTEARELLPNYPNQIGFNFFLSDRSRVFWVIIAAREIAALRYKRHFPHVKAMTAYLEKALNNLMKIDPDFFKATKE